MFEFRALGLGIGFKGLGFRDSGLGFGGCCWRCGFELHEFRESRGLQIRSSETT